MKNLKCEILSLLIDRYESSSYFNGKSFQKRNIYLDVNKAFPKYARSDSYQFTVDIEECVQFLCNENFISHAKGSVPGKLKIVLNTDDETISRIYSFIKRPILKEETQQFMQEIKEVKKYVEEDFVKQFLDYLFIASDNNNSYTIYVSMNSTTELKEIVTVLVEMANQKEEISLRAFSARVLHDSKKLKRNYLKKIFYVIRDFYEPSVENEIQALECFNIYTNPTQVFVKGKMIFKINDMVIDSAKMNNSFIFSSEHLSLLSICSIDANKVITVENLTSFYDMKVENALVIYLGGFHNSIRRKVLTKIYQHLGNSVEYYHFGDIDAGGYYIYYHLCNRTKIPFIPLYMDVQTLKKYYDFCVPLTNSDRKRLENLQVMYPSNQVFKYMLDNNIKLEQENVVVD